MRHLTSDECLVFVENDVSYPIMELTFISPMTAENLKLRMSLSDLCLHPLLPYERSNSQKSKNEKIIEIYQPIRFGVDIISLLRLRQH